MTRSEAPALIPGQLNSPTLPLSRYRQSWISGTVKAIAESTYSPGATALVLGNGHGNTLSELITAGYKAIALNPNPIPLLWTHCQLNPVPPERVQQAIHEIAYTHHAGHPLVQTIQHAYETECPKCQRNIQLRALLWDRDTQRPYQRQVQCPHCGTQGLFPVTESDYAKHAEFQNKLSPSRIFILQQIAPASSFFHNRADELLNLYSPRNLTILGTIIRQLSHSDDDPDVQRVLACLLLELLDRGSHLNPVNEPNTHPKSLRLPSTYYENNVWLILSEALDAYRYTLSRSNTTPQPGTHLGKLLKDSESGYVLLSRPLDYLNTQLHGEKVSTVIWQIDPPDSVFTSLSALWAGWLWGANAMHSMQDIIERRRHDLPWFEEELTRQCQILKTMLTDQASIVVLMPQATPEIIVCVRRAFQNTQYELVEWISTFAEDAYLLFRKGVSEGAAIKPIPQITEFAHSAIRAQHQPVPASFIANTYALSWAIDASPQIKFMVEDEMLRIKDDWVWALNVETPPDHVLYDRVEDMILQKLRSQISWTELALSQDIFAKFNGLYSPEPSLIQACIDSYATLNSRDQYALRREDEVIVRETDKVHIMHLLKTLGTRLQYTVYAIPNGDIIWQDNSQCAYQFRILTTGMVAQHLLAEKPECEGRCCLVIPGGRAGLIAYKLAHDPSLRKPVDQRIWTFIKFRHLRRMVDEIKNRSEIEVYLGLDPIAEQAQAQIPLSLQ